MSSEKNERPEGKAATEPAGDSPPKRKGVAANAGGERRVRTVDITGRGGRSVIIIGADGPGDPVRKPR